MKGFTNALFTHPTWCLKPGCCLLKKRLWKKICHTQILISGRTIQCTKVQIYSKSFKTELRTLKSRFIENCPAIKCCHATTALILRTSSKSSNYDVMSFNKKNSVNNTGLKNWKRWNSFVQCHKLFIFCKLTYSNYIILADEFYTLDNYRLT